MRVRGTVHSTPLPPLGEYGLQRVNAVLHGKQLGNVIISQIQGHPDLPQGSKFFCESISIDATGSKRPHPAIQSS